MPRITRWCGVWVIQYEGMAAICVSSGQTVLFRGNPPDSCKRPLGPPQDLTLVFGIGDQTYANHIWTGGHL